MNGVADGAIGELDSVDAKEWVARVFVRPFAGTDGALAGAGLGAALSHGRSHGSAGSPDLGSYRASGRTTFFTCAGSGADATVQDGWRRRMAVQANAYHRRFSAQLEWVRSSVEVARANRRAELSHAAWAAQVSAMLTDDAPSHGQVTPKRPVGAGGIGALPLAARHQRVDFESVAFSEAFADPTRSSQAARSVAIGANWYLNTHVRAGLHLERTGFVGGTPAGGDRPAELFAVLRLQALF